MIARRTAHHDITDLGLCLVGYYTAFFESLAHLPGDEERRKSLADWFRMLLEGDHLDTFTFKWALEGVWPSFHWDSTFRIFEASLAAGRWVAQPALEHWTALRTPEVAQAVAAWTPVRGPLLAGVIEEWVE